MGCQRAGSPSPGRCVFSLGPVWLPVCLHVPGVVGTQSSQREMSGINGVLCMSHLVMSDSLPPRSTVACQAPPSMGFCRQEHWSGLPCPLPGDFPNPGIEPRYVIYLQKMLAVISSSHANDSKAMHLLPC